MKRAFKIHSLFSLPRMNADQLLSVSTELITVAKADPQGTPAPEALTELVTQRDALAKGLMIRDAVPNVVPEQSRAAVIALRSAWRAFRDWTTATIQLPDAHSPAVPVLRTLHSVLFAAGMSWNRTTAREFWSKSASRLAAVTNGQFDLAVQTLGGTGVYEHLRSTHDTLGQVLGITKDVNVRSTALRAIVQSVSVALRVYTARVASSASIHDLAALERTQRILSPLETASIRRRGKPAKADETTTEETEGSSPVGETHTPAPTSPAATPPVHSG